MPKLVTTLTKNKLVWQIAECPVRQDTGVEESVIRIEQRAIQVPEEMF